MSVFQTIFVTAPLGPHPAPSPSSSLLFSVMAFNERLTHVWALVVPLTTPCLPGHAHLEPSCKYGPTDLGGVSYGGFTPTRLLAG